MLHKVSPKLFLFSAAVLSHLRKWSRQTRLLLRYIILISVVGFIFGSLIFHVDGKFELDDLLCFNHYLCNLLHTSYLMM